MMITNRNDVHVVVVVVNRASPPERSLKIEKRKSPKRRLQLVKAAAPGVAASCVSAGVAGAEGRGPADRRTPGIRRDASRLPKASPTGPWRSTSWGGRGS